MTLRRNGGGRSLIWASTRSRRGLVCPGELCEGPLVRGSERCAGAAHRTRSESAAGMPQSGGGHPWHRRQRQRTRELAPHRRVAALLKQSRCEQDVDHDTGRKLADPLLNSTALGEYGVHHLERRDPRELTQMSRCERPLGCRDFTADDRLA